jgi:hypothetical protein
MFSLLPFFFLSFYILYEWGLSSYLTLKRFHYMDRRMAEKKKLDLTKAVSKFINEAYNNGET